MAKREIPEQMTAVVLDSYTGVEAIRIEQRPVPKPGPDEVLVKVAASPINPSDLTFLEGSYGFKKPVPVVPGFEGSGTVVAVGAGMMGRYLNGKRVACISQDKGDGVWAEYMVTTTNYALPLDSSVSIEQGAMSAINPLTAIAFMEIIKDGGHKTIMHTAAASALGQMLNRLAHSQGIEIINVVRRDEQVDLLKKQGATMVLNSSDADFDQQLHDICHQHDVHLAFDAIAGSMTLQLLEAMPNHSKVTVYGGLYQEPAQAAHGHLIFQNKVVDGFWLTPWVKNRNFFQNLMTWRRAQKLLATELKTEIRVHYSLADVKNAVKEYQGRMTGGKVLLRMGQ
jgi:NADPH:quinone reductase-like Zn-dependent oxidoreductase